MNGKKSSVLDPAKYITFSILAVIAFILFTFVLMHNYDRSRGMNDKILVNVFGKQRMYTQLISKDANNLYVLLLEKETGYTDLSKDELSERITDLKDNMETAGKEYDSTLLAIHKRKIHYGTHTVTIGPAIIERSEYLTRIDVLWADFNAAIQVAIESDDTSAEALSAFDFIDSNNMMLLDLSEQLLDQLLKESLHKDRVTEYIEYGLIGMIIILLSYYLYNLLRFIILPYNQLYKGISEIGLTSYMQKPHLPTRKKVMPLVAEISDMFQNINSLISLIENISSNNSFMETLTYINKTFSFFIPYNYIGIAMISGDKKYLKATYGVTDGSITGLKQKLGGKKWPVSETGLGSYLESGQARIINDLEQHCAGKQLKSYNKIIMEAGIRASIALPLKVSGEPVGMIFFSSKNKNVYTEQHLKILATLANSIAISMNQNIFASEMQYSSVLALAKLSEARDEDTGEHMERIATYSRVIATLLYEKQMFSEEITIEFIDRIERCSPLHDIGKVAITDSILLKPGKLTPSEFDIMKKHTIYGAQVLKAADKNMVNKGLSLYGMGAEIAEGHHEKWDGSGYPHGKKGTEIPLCARITAVADVFDSLTSKRPYKEAFSVETSLKIITEGRAIHFDPVIVDTFLENRNRIEEIYHTFNMAGDIV